MATLKEKIGRNEQTYGSWITMAHPVIPELLSHAGFDWLAVDMEHSSIDLAQLLPLIISIEASGMVPLVRVGELNANLIKRIMDAGAHGVIGANVCNQQDAERLVNAVKYPPEGTRGVGLYRAQKYGEDFDGYQAWTSKESIVIAQIEHIDAVAHIDEIFLTPGVDGYLIGPYDLSGSLGKPGQFDLPELKSALAKVMEAGRRHGITAGYHSVSSDPKLAQQRAEDGYRFLAFGTDFMFLKDSAKTALRQLKTSLAVGIR